MTVSMEPQRISAMENRLISILEAGWVTRTDMESVVGTLVFITTVVGMRTYYRSFIELMRAQRRRSRLVLTDAVRSDMLKWQKLLHLFNGQSVYRGVRRSSSRFPLYTDASFSGWGFAWCDLVVPGKWPDPWLSRFGHLPKHLKHSGSHPDRIWIHFCEALAVLLALRIVTPFVGCNVVLKLYCDNSSVCGMLHKMQTSSAECVPIISEIAWILGAYQLELDVHWIDTKSNITADAASRWYAGKITSEEYLRIVAQFRQNKPRGLYEAGLKYSAPPRPEVLFLMDTWSPPADIDTACFPSTLKRCIPGSWLALHTGCTSPCS
eukprot:SAG31_NODE_1913_length_6933_cov_9.849722_3_plen_322_part_00